MEWCCGSPAYSGGLQFYTRNRSAAPAAGQDSHTPSQASSALHQGTVRVQYSTPDDQLQYGILVRYLLTHCFRRQSLRARQGPHERRLAEGSCRHRCFPKRSWSLHLKTMMGGQQCTHSKLPLPCKPHTIRPLISRFETDPWPILYVRVYNVL